MTAESTTTTPRAFTADELRQRFIAAWDATTRAELIQALTDNSDVQSVDVVRFDAATDVLVIDITSTWEDPDNQADAAWKITRAMAVFWTADELPVFHRDLWAPAFQLVNSGTTYRCAATFMQGLADVLASRADWTKACASTDAAADAATSRQHEADIAAQTLRVAELEAIATSLRTQAEVDTPALEAQRDRSAKVGAVNGAAMVQAEIDYIWANVAAADTAAAGADTELTRLEKLR